MELKGFIHGYICDNLGDDLLIALLVSKVPQVQWRVYVGQQNRAMGRLETICVRQTFVRRMVEKLQRCLFRRDSKTAKVDCYVSIGGSMYQEVEQWESIYASRSCELNSLNKDAASFVINSNFGPYHSEEFIALYKRYFERFSDVCFRDAKSQLLFGKTTRHAPDLLFSFPLPRYEGKGTIISVVDYSSSDRKPFMEAYENLILDIVKNAPHEAGMVTFISFCKAEGDEVAISRLFGKMPPELREKCGEYYYRGDFDEAVQVISKSKYVIGGRFHSMVLGLASSKPTFTLAYSDKTTDEYEYLVSMGLLHGSQGCISASHFAETNGEMIWEYLLGENYARIDEACRVMAQSQLDGVSRWVATKVPHDHVATEDCVITEAMGEYVAE